MIINDKKKTSTKSSFLDSTSITLITQRQQKHDDDYGDDKNGSNVAESGWRDENGIFFVGYELKNRRENRA